MLNSTQPLISIIICNYNYGSFLEAALNSAVGQTYKKVEVIVVDDGSTDNSREILHRWQDRIKVVTKENEGQCSAYNAGFAICNGEFVIFLDSDDFLDVNAVSVVVQAFSEGVAKVHYRMRLVDANGTQLGICIPRILARGNVGDHFLKSGYLYPSAPGSGNAYRKNVLTKLFPLPISEIDRHGADLYAIHGSSLFGEVRSIDEPLANYRVHNKEEASNSLFFGNTSTGNPVCNFDRRVQLFKNWITLRTNGTVQLPERFLEFGIEKCRFTNAIFNNSNYITSILTGLKPFGNLFDSIRLCRYTTFLIKVGLIGWAMLVLLAPRPLAFQIARYVCNPSSRH